DTRLDPVFVASRVSRVACRVCGAASPRAGRGSGCRVAGQGSCGLACLLNEDCALTGRTWIIPLVAVLAAVLLGGCSDRRALGRGTARPSLATAAAAELPAVVKPIAFVDVAASAGIRFRHTTGAFGQKWFPETNGSGAAFFDFD